jgi:hypothetical protein
MSMIPFLVYLMALLAVAVTLQLLKVPSNSCTGDWVIKFQVCYVCKTNLVSKSELSAEASGVCVCNNGRISCYCCNLDGFCL